MLLTHSVNNSDKTDIDFAEASEIKISGRRELNSAQQNRIS